MNKNNIVQFERRPEFYFDLGYKYIQKGKLKTALRYIEKAAMMRPEDSFIQFNYAGILAELGDIDKSTEVLLNIVNNLEPDYSECYFGLGCNYLQQQKIKKAITYFGKYLELDPEGEFTEEAEDLLEMLTMIKDANNDLDDEIIERIYEIEEEAVQHLENHEYDIAIKKFEYVVEILPNAVPARNNLSLTNYYIGNIEKAVELAKEVLRYEPENVHANCNLAIFYNKQRMTSLVEAQLKIIQRLYTENPEYLYKIADTLGSLGKHKSAFKTYKKLISIDNKNPIYLHYAAIAAFNSNKYSESIKIWENLKNIDDAADIADFYINHAQKVWEEIISFDELPYLYQLPWDEISLRINKIYELLELSGEALASKIDKNDEIKELMYFGINFDRNVLGKLIFTKIKSEHIYSMEEALRKLALKKELDDSVKIEAVFSLDILKAVKPYEIYIDNEIITVAEEPVEALELPQKELLLAVKNIVISRMEEHYSMAFKADVENIWYSFIKNVYPDLPNIQKTEAWCAALEYAVCKKNNIKATQANIAKYYSVSVNTLRDKAREILDIL